MAELCAAARQAARTLAQTSTAAKNDTLRIIADHLRSGTETLLEANQRDLSAAQGQSAAFRDRLTLTPARIEAMASGLEEIVRLPDPVGDTIGSRVMGWLTMRF